MTATCVERYYNGMGMQVWGYYCQQAVVSHKFIRIASVPIFFGTIVKESLKAPLIVLESLGRTVCCIRRNPQQANMYLFHAVRYLFRTPVGPLIGLVDGVRVAVTFVFAPLTTAKVNYAKHELIDWIAREQLQPSQTIGKYELAWAAFARFKKNIWFKKTISEVIETRLMEDLPAEVQGKIALLNASRAQYDAQRESEPVKQGKTALLMQEMAEIWAQYVKDLLASNLDEARNLALDFSTISL